MMNVVFWFTPLVSQSTQEIVFFGNDCSFNSMNKVNIFVMMFFVTLLQTNMSYILQCAPKDYDDGYIKECI